MLKGTTNGRIGYTHSKGVNIYRVFGATPKKVTTPKGIYTGEIDLKWRDGSKGKTQSATGRMSILLDLKAGQAHVDSILGNQNNTIQVMGSAKVVGGSLKSNDMTVMVANGDGGNMRKERGQLRAVIASGAQSSAIFGTVVAKSNKTGFRMNGGFSTGYSKKFPSQIKW